MTAYAFPNAWEAAQRRLELLEECCDAASIRRAEALGVASGWRCLDAGRAAGRSPAGLRAGALLDGRATR